VGIAERAEDLHEGFARDRRRYERLVYGRMRDAICWQDAEDIVSEALIRALAAVDTDPPQPGNEQAWFTRIVFNGGVDFLRSRDGRRREGSRPRPDVVSLDALQTVGVELAGDVELAGSTDAWIEALDGEADCEQARELVQRVLSCMPREDAELVKLRHLLSEDATRDEVAAMAGLTLGEFRWRYSRAWSRFVDTISAEQPSDRCHEIRTLIGDPDATGLDVAARIDAHVLDCPSCRVFARDSYRVLELLPFIPTAGAAERWSARVASLWERFGPEAAAGGGATAAGAGASGALGAGAAGTLKVAILCTTVVTAGVCGKTLLLHHQGHKTPGKRGGAIATRTTPRAHTQAATTTRRQPTPSSRRSASSSRRTVAYKPQSAIPATAPQGSQEFQPSGSGERPAPAPAPVTGGGEFGP
jgi:DNA-directed RNA polymerase specialized sigma24 family protein